MKVLTVIGARPQFVKAAAVTRALARAGVDEFMVHTGQHYDANMSDLFFSELGLPKPHLNLQVGSGTHGQQTAAILTGVERAIAAEAPEFVLVYGDTNSTLGGALAAAKLRVPLGHVEAGLRSFNRAMPEEINRIVADSISDLLFAPTRLAVANLEHEGCPPSRVRLVGDVMYDSVLMFARLARSRSDILRKLQIKRRKYALATIHRAENTDDARRLACIVEGLEALARRTKVVWPIHPRTKVAVEKLELSVGRRVELVEPVGFLDMLELERNAAVVITDSGGVQKEAFFHRVPCVTVRDETEWVELVESGWNHLCPPTSANEIELAARAAMRTRGRALSAYGDGSAADAIAGHLLEFCRPQSRASECRTQGNVAITRIGAPTDERTVSIADLKHGANRGAL